MPAVAEMQMDAVFFLMLFCACLQISWRVNSSLLRWLERCSQDDIWMVHTVISAAKNSLPMLLRSPLSTNIRPFPRDSLTKQVQHTKAMFSVSESIFLTWLLFLATINIPTSRDIPGVIMWFSIEWSSPWGGFVCCSLISYLAPEQNRPATSSHGSVALWEVNRLCDTKYSPLTLMLPG